MMTFLRQAFCLYGKTLCVRTASSWILLNNRTCVYPHTITGTDWKNRKTCYCLPYTMTNRGLASKIDNESRRYRVNEHKPAEMKQSNQMEGNGSSYLVRDVHQAWIREITQAGVPEPEESVNLIVAHACGKKMIHEVSLDTQVSRDVVEHVNMMCRRRLDRVPVQYIIGEWDFHDMTLNMEPGVLIPRPETEELGGFIVDDLSTRGTDGCYRILDIGCGTGALSLYILKCLPNTTCIAVDKNKKACSLTHINAEIYSLQDRLQIVHGDIFEDNCTRQMVEEGPFDIIVSNPPYIPLKDMEVLEPEIARYEDREALCGGENGLDVIKQIVKLSRKLLKPESGSLWLEVDLSHPDKIEQIIHTSPHYCLQYVKTIQDFTNRGRFCKLQIKP